MPFRRLVSQYKKSTLRHTIFRQTPPPFFFLIENNFVLHNSLFCSSARAQFAFGISTLILACCSQASDKSHR